MDGRTWQPSQIALDQAFSSAYVEAGLSKASMSSIEPAQALPFRLGPSTDVPGFRRKSKPGRSGPTYRSADVFVDGVAEAGPFFFDWRFWIRGCASNANSLITRCKDRPRIARVSR
jgi:hypothetical protein